MNNVSALSVDGILFVEYTFGIIFLEDLFVACDDINQATDCFHINPGEGVT